MMSRLAKATRIAGYQLGEVLGQGGFGITYKAKQLKTGELAAIKEFFPSDYAIRDGATVLPHPKHQKVFELGLKAFLEEAFILRDLPQVAGLVQVKAAFEKHGTAYCVMEYIKGDPLERMVPRLIQHNGHVPENLVRTVVYSMCHALNAVHLAGLIHRDIKAANIMIRVDEQPVLIDFGAARPLGRNSAMGAMFTRKYAALEQFPPELLGEERLPIKEGPESDLFALSVMLYEMVSQSLPPPANDRYIALRDTRRDPYLPVATNLKRNRVEATYSPELLALIDRGCALLPRDRPQSAQAYEQDLRPNAPYTARRAAVPPISRSPAPQSAVDPSMRPLPRKPQRALQRQGQKRSNGTHIPSGPMVMLMIILGLAVMAILYGYLTRF
jgi:serine/threonine protein kinase